ncbi:MAG: hypothetical protein IJZ40_02540 [Bacteroidaceae bacterium]|nr:hypothetical protein [Bacteroidaceae bacterium]
MKKIFLAAMTLVMAVFASCSNEDVNVENNNELKVTFSVADKAGWGVDARAVKTGWEANDEILIAICSEGGWTIDGSFNCFKLKYNGSAWTTDKTGFDTSVHFESGNYYIAVYHPGTITLGSSVGTDEQFLSGYNGGEILYDINSTYTKTADGIDLGEIELVRHSQDFQISIKDLASAGKADGTWKLYIKDADGNDAHNMYFDAAGKAFLRDTGFGTYSTNYSTGINYKGDVVFYFSNAGSDETSLKFELTDGTDTYTCTTTTIPEMGNAYTLPAITDAKWTKVIP